MLASEKISRTCQDRRLDLSSLASKAQIPYSTLLSYVNSRRRMPPANTGVRIAAVLGVSADWLFDDSKDWPPPEPAEAASLDTIPDAQLVHTMMQRCGHLLNMAHKTLARLPKTTGTDGRVEISKPLFKEIQTTFAALDVQADYYAWAGGTMLETSQRVQRVCKDVRIEILRTGVLGDANELQAAFPMQFTEFQPQSGETPASPDPDPPDESPPAKPPRRKRRPKT